MTGCHLCDADNAPSSFEGQLIDGGYGRFDQVSLVFIKGTPANTGRLCDACLERLIAEDRVEIYDEPGFFESGRRPGRGAYAALFRAGAERIYVRFHELNGARVYDTRPLAQEGRNAIRDLVALMTGDDTWSDQAHIERRSAGQHALAVGETHALCAISLGYGEEDHHFAQEAALWAARRIEIDMFIELNRQSLFGPML